MIGILMLPRFLYASITPEATLSQRTIPPKILMRMAFTLGSCMMILNPASTVCALAVPPTSRKLAGSPPLSLIMSMVAMAKPAPFTMQPTLPSSFTKLRLNFPASTSVGSSSEKSRMAARSACLPNEFSSMPILQSTAMILSSAALKRGLISSMEQSRPT